MLEIGTEVGPRRVLVVDDNEAIHDDFRKTLGRAPAGPDLRAQEALLFGDTTRIDASPRPTFEIDTASQGHEALAKVRQAIDDGRPYQVAFVDMRMPPGWDGVETISRIWEADPRLQVVICTAYSDSSWDQIRQRLGLTDRMLILKKPFEEVEVCQLASAMTEKWLQTRQAQLKLAEMEMLVAQRTSELRNAAMHDRLTGLPNRAHLTSLLRDTVARNGKGGRYAVLFLDFDRFKVVNDSLGHGIGDQLLCSIARRLEEVLGNACDDAPELKATAARLGGDEFVILLDGLRQHEQAAAIAGRLIEALSRPHDLCGHQIQATASIGVTTSALAYSCSDDILRDADTAMYRAKAAGRAQYVVFDQRMHEEAMMRLTTENDLRRAVDERQLMLLYQPMVSLESARVVGFEALVRWRHPTRGIIAPNQFISIAEEIGMIIPIGRWVTAEACRQMGQWQRQRGLSGMFVSVNLSRKQLASPDLAADIARAVADAGIAPTDLKMEITESILMEDMEQAIEVLGEIRRLGIDLHMDDFGTGYSSLSCLHRFPISALKIDRAFVNNIAARHDYAAVVYAIVALALNLRIKLVAEGVETEEQMQLLQALGCDHAQGYYFARPLPPEEALEFALKQGTALAA